VTATPTADRATVALVGDLVPTQPAFDGDAPLDPEVQPLIDVLRAADVSVGCLLTPLSEGGRPSAKMIALRVAPSFAADVRKLGIDVVHLANNHIMDYGEEALADTCRALEGEGVAHFGAGPDLAAATRALVVDRGGVRIGLLAWSTLLPTGAEAGEGRPGIAPLPVRVSYEFDPLYLTEEPTMPPVVRSRVDEAGLAAVVARVAEVRATVDVLIVALHWGEGIGDRVAEYQRPLAHAVAEAGADVVYGTHPHSVFGIEVHAGRPILYSPGLFLDQTPREGNSPEVQAVYDQISPDSYVALVEVADGRASALRIVPTTVGAGGVPVIAEGAARERIVRRLAEFSQPYGTRIDVSADGIVVPLG
jgi:poly-gamma-glutamate capsule biosynthesis protein CapA/YwtB (metallophosphatase superfamily)